MAKLHAPIKGIFFDLGWTLFTPTSGDWMYTKVGRKFFPKEAMAALPQEKHKAVLAECEEYLNTHHLLSTMEEEYGQFHRYFTVLAQAFPELGVSEKDIGEMMEDRMYNMENYALFPDTLPTLEALKGKYRLGVISDTWPSVNLVLDHFGLRKYFDCITFSYTLGVYKPHPRMYEDALAKMGLPPEQTVFIDDFTGNLEGAQAAGIQPVLIQAKPDPDDTEDMPKIKTIAGILDILP